MRKFFGLLLKKQAYLLEQFFSSLIVSAYLMPRSSTSKTRVLFGGIFGLGLASP